MTSVKLYLFGFPRLERDGQPEPVNRRKMLALLGYLIVTNQSHSREALATLLWPEFDTSSALANLRRDLSRLKEILGTDILHIDREKVQVKPDADVWVDVRRFDAIVQLVEQHGHWRTPSSKPPHCAQCQALLDEAAGLYSDGFLAGFNLPDSPTFDEWQFFQSDRLRRQLANLLIQQADWLIEQGSFDKAVEPARRWLSLDPLHEPANRLLMQLYAWTGQPTAALRQYNILADLLAQELGVEPEEATKALKEAIRARQLSPPAVTAGPLAGAVKLAGAIKLPEKPAERFTIGTLLSTGGFGEIYRGHDHLTNKTVAVKRLLPHLIASKPGIVERFVREGAALGQLSHPNIVPMLAFYEHEGTYNLVMEYLEGGTLRDLLEREHALPVAKTLDIALELADALSRAHHLHILHRDIKPENILLDNDGHPRLIDFGLALLQGQDSRLTQDGMLMGSPIYMSPEAIQGKELDQRSDIWSFGILLYEMLAGSPPFHGDQIHVLLNQILNQDAPPLSLNCPGIPAELERLVARMLDKDPERRIQSMRQAAADLEAIRDGKLTAGGTVRAGESSLHRTDSAQPPYYIVELPAQPTPFIGRQSELDQLYELLDNPEVRLVTLTGTGGIGKTRLAVEAATQMAKFLPNGAVFVPLAPVNDANFIIPAIASALRIRFTPGVDTREQLLHRLSHLKMLLVLDNYEHLLDSAGLISVILAASPNIQVLVTSRERLNIVEEWVFEVGGLGYPAVGELDTTRTGSWAENFGSVQLFIDRARRADPQFQADESALAAIVKICQLVEGMPLALELAAPWVRAMDCAEIARELMRGLDILTTSMRNLPDRHRSVRVVFDRSWQSLTALEQSILSRLSVFRNGCTREAAEKITGARPFALMTLVDKALIRHRGSRFEMHELVRQYATERLSQDPQMMEETLDKHYTYYLELLEQANHGLKGGRQIETGRMILLDIDNIRAAWKRAVVHRDLNRLTQAAEPYWLFNEFRGTLAEGEEAIRQAADAIEAQEDDQPLVGFLRAAQGSLLARQWNFELGRALMEQGLDLLRKTGQAYPEKTAFALAWYGFLNVAQGHFPEGARAAQESLDYFPQTGDRWTQAGALRLLGAADLYQGQLQRAREYLIRCVSVCKAIGELRIRTYATSNLGVIHLWLGQIADARSHFEESMRISKSCNDRLARADALCESVRLFIAIGEYERAKSIADKSIQIYHELGRLQVSLPNIMLGKILHLMGKDGAEEVLHKGLASARSVNHRPDIAAGLEALGSLSLDRQEYETAQRYFDEAAQIWTDIGSEPEIAMLLCRSAIGLIEAGTANEREIRERLLRALHMGRKHQAETVVLTAMIGLSALQAQAGEAKKAAPAITYATKHPATPTEVREWLDRFLSRLPTSSELPDEPQEPAPPWESLVAHWSHQFSPS